jgi:hypothetical protein
VTEALRHDAAVAAAQALLDEAPDGLTAAQRERLGDTSYWIIRAMLESYDVFSRRELMRLPSRN